jgi:hypothetical protein
MKKRTVIAAEGVAAEPFLQELLESTLFLHVL